MALFLLAKLLPHLRNFQGGWNEADLALASHHAPNPPVIIVLFLG